MRQLSNQTYKTYQAPELNQEDPLREVEPADMGNFSDHTFKLVRAQISRR
jgi:hypothetical protein